MDGDWWGWRYKAVVVIESVKRLCEPSLRAGDSLLDLGTGEIKVRSG